MPRRGGGLPSRPSSRRLRGKTGPGPGNTFSTAAMTAVFTFPCGRRPSSMVIGRQPEPSMTSTASSPSMTSFSIAPSPVASSTLNILTLWSSPFGLRGRGCAGTPHSCRKRRGGLESPRQQMSPIKGRRKNTWPCSWTSPTHAPPTRRRSPQRSPFSPLGILSSLSLSLSLCGDLQDSIASRQTKKITIELDDVEEVQFLARGLFCHCFLF